MSDRFRSLVAGTRDIVAAVDLSGSLTYLSPSAESTLGFGPADLGAVLWELVHPDDVAAVHAAVRDAFLGEEGKSVEFQVLTATGRWHRLEAVVQLVESDGTREAVVGATDVTEVRQVEAELRARDDELRQARKMEVVGRLAGGITHDFGNLLTVIIGASEHLLDGLPGESPLRPHAESIRETAARAGSMVRQLLSFSRQRGAAPASLDLNVVIGSAAQLLQRLLGSHIEFDVIPGPDLWAVNADRTQIEQVLLNLTANARDAMAQGGRLTIETRNMLAEGMGAFDWCATGPCVVVSISDTGGGMDPATQARAFEPFFTTKGEGTGFGLATVRRVIEQAGGWVHLVSALGLGTTVAFGLPPTGAPAVAPLPPPAPLGGGETLLIVEDEEGVRELVRDILSLAGYRVLEASAPSEAERISREFDAPVHLLLTDVVMPEMSGFDLSARLVSSRPDLQVLYMSGFPAPEGTDGLTDTWGHHFIAKPFDRHGLLRAVREALDASPLS